nr:RbsD/FucU domain-containing protein [Dorea sp. Marseille-P4042]
MSIKYDRRYRHRHEKTWYLNSAISRVLSYMGHTVRICIEDCGLPISDETERIDLALKFGQPRFLERSL